MHFRTATVADTAAIKHVVFSCLTEYGLPIDENGPDADLNNVEQSYLNNQGYFAVIEYDEQIIATVGLHKEDADTCELRKMYMLKEYRGRGFGRKILDFALAKARAMGFSYVSLETASVLKEAIALYEAYGFQAEAVENAVARCDRCYRLNIASR